jgi:hypothetical protein
MDVVYITNRATSNIMTGMGITFYTRIYRKAKVNMIRTNLGVGTGLILVLD